MKHSTRNVICRRADKFAEKRRPIVTFNKLRTQYGNTAEYELCHSMKNTKAKVMFNEFIRVEASQFHYFRRDTMCGEG
jgi:hypothetical protein